MRPEHFTADSRYLHFLHGDAYSPFSLRCDCLIRCILHILFHWAVPHSVRVILLAHHSLFHFCDRINIAVPAGITASRRVPQNFPHFLCLRRHFRPGTISTSTKVAMPALF